MKLFNFLTLFLILSACCPEKMLNRILDGNWNLVSINGENIDSNLSETLLFNPKQKGGDLKFNKVENGEVTIKSGIYALIKTGSVSFAFPNNLAGSGYDTETYEITNHTKTNLTLTQQGNGNNVYSFEKQ